MKYCIEQWPELIEHAICNECNMLKRAHVIRETPSTQSAARLINCAPGDVIIAWRQTAGFGRLHRPWIDTGEHGVALTLVLARQSTPEHYALTTALGVARAAEALLKRAVKIKWPNDIIVDGRKLAGILIEQVDDRALIGIGLNVHQDSWPDELRSRAISLHQAGCDCDRLDVITTLLKCVDRAIQCDLHELEHEFSQRDLLVGRNARFRCRADLVSGRVLRVDPLQGLEVKTGDGVCWLPAATTTVLDFEPSA